MVDRVAAHYRGVFACTGCILMMGTDFVDRFDFGCKDGIHTRWAVVEAESESAARKMVPPFVRSKARIVKVSEFTPQQIRAAHK